MGFIRPPTPQPRQGIGLAISGVRQLLRRGEADAMVLAVSVDVLRKLEQTLRQKEKLADGLHLIDFEQLKIENQTLNEKIEERNEELLKLRKKTTTTVQVLTHLKEKLQFVQKKNNILESELGDLDMQLSSKRDKLQREKQSREKARDDIMKLREKSGLVTDPVLLQDVEKQKQKVKKSMTARTRRQLQN